MFCCFVVSQWCLFAAQGKRIFSPIVKPAAFVTSRPCRKTAMQPPRSATKTTPIPTLSLASRHSVRLFENTPESEVEEAETENPEELMEPITFMGLPPKQEVDVFDVPPIVGTIIFFASMYFTIMVFFTDKDPFATGVL